MTPEVTFIFFIRSNFGLFAFGAKGSSAFLTGLSHLLASVDTQDSTSYLAFRGVIFCYIGNNHFSDPSNRERGRLSPDLIVHSYCDNRTVALSNCTRIPASSTSLNNEESLPKRPTEVIEGRQG